ncbi:ASCH domain protein [compost metagenome]
MILFKLEHIVPILAGTKTQTRRTGKLRWKVGSVRQAKTNYREDSEFAKIRILTVRQERLGDISEEDANAEGYLSIADFQDAFRRIYGGWEPDQKVWVIDFERVDQFGIAPARKEEIKRIIESGRQVHLSREEVSALLDAVEEAQQILNNLRAERDGLKEHRSELAISNTDLQGKLLEAHQSIARQEKALEFYAEAGNYLEHIIGWGPVNPVLQDGGKLARKALGIKEGDGES